MVKSRLSRTRSRRALFFILPALVFASFLLHTLLRAPPPVENEAITSPDPPASTFTPVSFSQAPTTIPDPHNNPNPHPFVSEWSTSPIAQILAWKASPPGAPLKSPFYAPADRVAVIVNTERSIEQLLPLISHFSKVLGNTWPILVVVSNKISGEFQRKGAKMEKAFEGLIAAGLISFVSIPAEVMAVKETTTSEEARDNVLQSTWFWQKEVPESVEHLLVFSADTILCSLSPFKVNDFLGWDFIGAPTLATSIIMFEGSLSLRNAKQSRRLVSEQAGKFLAMGMTSDNGLSETKFFLDDVIVNWGILPDKTVAGRWASNVQARDGDVWDARAFGYTRIGEGVEKKRKEELEAWCPEYRLALY